jgi:hypothetical protein
LAKLQDPAKQGKSIGAITVLFGQSFQAVHQKALPLGLNVSSSVETENPSAVISTLGSLVLPKDLPSIGDALRIPTGVLNESNYDTIYMGSTE